MKIKRPKLLICVIVGGTILSALINVSGIALPIIVRFTLVLVLLIGIIFAI